jgi:hypothetical protein
VTTDRAEIVRERFWRGARARVRALVTDELIAEHEARPLGPHSDDLARVLTYLRGVPVEGKEVVLTVEPDRRWRTGRIRRADLARPLALEGAEQTALPGALHAIFVARIDELRRTGGDG